MFGDTRNPIASDPGTFSLPNDSISGGGTSHFNIASTDGLSLSNFLASLGAGGNANGSPADLSELSITSTNAASPADGLDNHNAGSDGGEPGSIFATAFSGSIAVADYVNEFKAQNGGAVDGNSYIADWSGSTDDLRHSSVDVSYLPADLAGNFFAGDGLSDFSADAKGGAGGKPSGGGSGGGGGGGGGSLLTTYISGNPNVDDAAEFNIQINFSGSWTAKQQAIVVWAADTWSSIITGDIHNDTDLNGNLVDDIVINVSTGRIDGNGNPLFGNVLAQTSDLVVRDPGTEDQWLPLTASIALDSTDLKNSAFADAWDDIILHEMGHALGFVGAIFDNLGLTDGSGNFTGANAVSAYGGLVPLEDGGGSGTAGSHWDEATFAPDGTLMSNELMTGYFVPGEQTYLSDTTIGALADLGYTVQDPSIGSSYLAVDSHLLIA
jgi:hypothetical protein